MVRIPRRRPGGRATVAVAMKYACVFPGQGSQSPGMMNGYAGFAVVRATFDEASEVLGEDLWTLVNEGPADRLDLTVNTQPLMLTADVAVYRAWESLGKAPPSFVAGHSLGEYAALVAAAALTFADAVSLVHFRAEMMQQAVPEGAGGMAAILGLDDESVRRVCRQVVESSHGELVEPANFNSPGQVVISGHRNAVVRGMELALSAGARRALMLPVSVPSHCSLMSRAAERMRQKLEQVTFMSPRIPVLHNADVRWHADPAEIKGILVRQLCEPVRWTETVHALAAAGIHQVLECGPGKVLSGLIKRIEPNMRGSALTDDVAIRRTAEALA